jgi:hypothetical protein
MLSKSRVARFGIILSLSLFSLVGFASKSISQTEGAESFSAPQSLTSPIKQNEAIASMHQLWSKFDSRSMPLMTNLQWSGDRTKQFRGDSMTCFDYIYQGAMLNWATHQQNRLLNHGTLDIRAFDGQQWLGLQTNRNTSTPTRVGLNGYISNTEFVLENSDYQEFWSGSCDPSGGGIRGTVFSRSDLRREFTFWIGLSNRANYIRR